MQVAALAGAERLQRGVGAHAPRTLARCLLGAGAARAAFSAGRWVVLYIILMCVRKILSLNVPSHNLQGGSVSAPFMGKQHIG